jgi:hypothetical protein
MPAAGSTQRALLGPHQIDVPDRQGPADQEEKELIKANVFLKLLDEQQSLSVGK